MSAPAKFEGGGSNPNYVTWLEDRVEVLQAMVGKVPLPMQAAIRAEVEAEAKSYEQELEQRLHAAEQALREVAQHGSALPDDGPDASHPATQLARAYFSALAALPVPEQRK